jgi:hypothetical protein
VATLELSTETEVVTILKLEIVLLAAEQVEVVLEHLEKMPALEIEPVTVATALELIF